jgi:hypothetical protein
MKQRYKMVGGGRDANDPSAIFDVLIATTSGKP